jgi:hypothetical protein
MFLKKLKEKIADLFNHGLSDAETIRYLHTISVTAELGKYATTKDLIAVIRDLMFHQEKEHDVSPRSESVVPRPPMDPTQLKDDAYYWVVLKQIGIDQRTEEQRTVIVQCFRYGPSEAPRFLTCQECDASYELCDIGRIICKIPAPLDLL